MNSTEESRLRQHYESLRAADAPAVASFAVTLAAAERRALAANRKVSPTWVVAVLVAMLCGGTFALLRVRATRDTPLAEPVAIAAWSSPTAFLLETPGRKLPARAGATRTKKEQPK